MPPLDALSAAIARRLGERGVVDVPGLEEDAETVYGRRVAAVVDALSPREPEPKPEPEPEPESLPDQLRGLIGSTQPGGQLPLNGAALIRHALAQMQRPPT